MAASQNTYSDLGFVDNLALVAQALTNVSMSIIWQEVLSNSSRGSKWLQASSALIAFPQPNISSLLLSKPGQSFIHRIAATDISKHFTYYILCYIRVPPTRDE